MLQCLWQAWRMSENVKIHQSWKNALGDEFDKDYMKQLRGFIASELANGKTIYPHGSEIFTAFNTTPFDHVKVVIIGQDPYHGPGQAHGLCFSVKPGIKPPPSLVNIYKELKTDLGIEPVSHGYLLPWAEQGVLMLNAVLTVEKKQAASHQGKGWERFTDRVVQELNESRKNIVFLLWGRYAQKKGEVVDRSKHLVLECAHPSPFSATRFYGNKHFSRANQYLSEHGLQNINWQLPQEISL